MFSARLNLTEPEKKTLLEWLLFTGSDSQHYGDGQVTFPEEASLKRSLSKKSGKNGMLLTRSQAEIIRDAMNKNIKRKYGNSEIILPAEETLVAKVKDFLLRLEKENDEILKKIRKEK
ncbi:MAG: hypothetical protein ACLFQK_08540 [Fibrobacterota bacterium]